MAPTIPELDLMVQSFYEGRGEQQKAAQTALNQFKEDPDAWLLVDSILSESKHPQTKCTPRYWYGNDMTAED
ncbi:Karyopherin transporter [Parahypoxylon ruwenzoriense]